MPEFSRRNSRNPARRQAPPGGWYRHALAKGLIEPKPSLAQVQRGNAFLRPRPIPPHWEFNWDNMIFGSPLAKQESGE